jgi:hypothetical protein
MQLVRRYAPDKFEIVALSAGKNLDVLAEQIRKFKPKMVVGLALVTPGCHIGYTGVSSILPLAEVDTPGFPPSLKHTPPTPEVTAKATPPLPGFYKLEGQAWGVHFPQG